MRHMPHDPSRYRTREWRQARAAVLRRCNFRCEQCGRPGRLEVHHKAKIREGGSDDLDNLEALCRACHFAQHKRKPRTPERAEWIALLES